MRLRPTLAIAFLALAAAPAAAQQGRGRGQADTVPKSHLPPPGMCRIWLPNVPPAKQAAPTDCATAVRNRPRNARVVFGDSVSRGKTPAAPPSVPVTPLIPRTPPVTPPPPDDEAPRPAERGGKKRKR